MAKSDSSTDFLELQQKLENIEEELEKYKLSAEEATKAVARLDEIMAAMYQEQIQYRETNDQRFPS
jgi:hypothetical protein